MSNPTYNMKPGELIAGARTLWVPMEPQPVAESEGMFGTLWRWMEFVGVAEMIEIMMEDRCPYRIGQTLALCEGWRIGWYTDDLWTVDYQDGTTSEPIERCEFQKPRLEPVDDSLDDEWRPASTMPAWAVRHHFGPLTSISVKRLSEATLDDSIDAGIAWRGFDIDGESIEWDNVNEFTRNLTALHGTAEWFWEYRRDSA